MVSYPHLPVAEDGVEELAERVPHDCKLRPVGKSSKGGEKGRERCSRQCGNWVNSEMERGREMQMQQ